MFRGLQTNASVVLAYFSRSSRFLALLLTIGYLVFVAWGLTRAAPPGLIEQEMMKLYSSGSRDPGISGRQPTIVSRRIPASPFLALAMVFEVRGAFEDKDVSVRLVNDELVTRYDQLVLWTGIWFMLTLILLWVPSLFGSPAPPITDSPPLPSRDRTVDDVLSAEVLATQQRANQLYSRSTLLLLGGIVMAFIGVGVFYVTLPELGSAEPTIRLQSEGRPGPASITRTDLTNYLARAIRPLGILFFVEGIAWYLLRQYRLLVEDFKSFHRIQLRRVNYLAAQKVLATKKPSASELVFAAALMQEDLSGRLKKDETTEALELAKTPDANPVFDFFQAAIKALTGKGKAAQ